MKKKFIFGIIISTLLIGISTFTSLPKNENNYNIENYIEMSEPITNKINNNIVRNKKLQKNQETNEKERLLSKEDFYIEPAYGDYEIGNNMTRANEDTPDEYESNNSFSNAYLLSSKPSGKPYNYSFSIDATLHIEPWYYLFWRDIDEDYYRFDVYANANLVIGMKNIASGLDYDLELYMHNNNPYPSEDSVSIVRKSTKGSNLDEYISVSLSPGTYYARVYSYEGHSAWSEYNLYGSITYPDINNSASISDLRYNKGAGAAVWISDLDPFGYKPFETYTKEEVGYRYYDFSGSLYPMNIFSFENPFYQNVNYNTNIPHSIIYIWDVNIRTELYDIMTQWENKLVAEIKTNKELRTKLEFTMDIIDGVNTLVGIALSVVSMKPEIAIAVAVGQAGVSPITAAILKTMYPEAWDTSLDILLTHIRYIKNAIECNASSPSNEVVKIPVTYKYVRENPFVLNASMTTYYLDYTPEYSSSGYLYDNDTISYYQNNGIYGGKVYGIRDFEDIEIACNREGTQLEDVNTGGNTQLIQNVAIIENINKGQYHWYNFTAPTRGEYTFYTEGSCDTYGEVFSEIVPAHSIKNRLQYDDDSGMDFNFSITRLMNPNETIYLRVRGYSTNTTGSYSLKVEKTGDYELISRQITPENYGYTGTYNFESIQKEVVLEDGYTFLTNRLRCGYITYEGNSYLTLSAKRKDAGCAFLEYYFDEKIYAIDYSMALWSDIEALNKNSSIQLQYLDDSNKWKTAIVFNTNDMSKSKDDLYNYSYDFETPTNGFRFYITTNEVNNDNNRGRVVIGDINIYC